MPEVKGQNLKTASRDTHLAELSPANVASPSAEQARLIEDAITTLRGISRTFQGVGDTSTSPDKIKLLLDGSALASRVADNFRRAVAFLLNEDCRKFEQPEDIAAMIRHAVTELNQGLTSEKHGFWRSWETPHGHPSPAALQDSYKTFCAEFLRRRLDPSGDPISFAAWTERAFNAEIHPLSDGCGRCSKALAVAILAAAGIAYPRFHSREEYFKHILKSPAEWEAFYRRKIEANSR